MSARRRVGSGRPNEPLLDRRTLLKLAATAAATAPGATLLDGSAAPMADRQSGFPRARETRVLPVTSSVTLGGAALRPPSIPLAVRSPYLSTWLPATNLTAATPQFWRGSTRGFVGLARIDGHVYAWAGRPKIDGAAVAAMPQTSVEVTATSSIFTLQARGVQLVAEWLSPVEPGLLRWQSVPFSLLTVSVTAVDGFDHAVQVYAEINGEWASSDEGAVIRWATTASARTRHWAIELEDQRPLTERDQMAQWGTVVWATPRHRSSSYQSGYAGVVRRRFVSGGVLADTSDPDFRSIGDNQPVFAFAHDFDSAGGSVAFALGHVRTPLVGYGEEHTPLAPLWTRYWPGWGSMTDDFLADAAAARQRAKALDAMIERAATQAGGFGYSAVCALSLRQCYGGTELAVGPEGRPWLFGKEMSSGGFVNTVDIFDQAFLAWLWLDPDRIPLVMEPVLDWCASPAWQDPSAWAGVTSWEDSMTRYCVHDLGRYPVASGRTPGEPHQMPIEESAGMLIMAAAYTRKVGAAVATPFLSRWEELWTQWAQYLLTQVPTPAKQLCTDDWAPVYAVSAGSVNLGIKAIVGLAAAGQIASTLGDAVSAADWSGAAEDNVGPWVTLSTDPTGGHLNVVQGASGTWSTLYNAYYEKVIGLSLVPEHVASMQAAFYLTQLTNYGMPLQSDAENLGKVEWLLYTQAWLDQYPISEELLTRDVAYINDTPSLVPYCDRYDTTTGVAFGAIRAHATVGAVFALLASQAD